MDRDRDSIWSRRSGSNKLSLSNQNGDSSEQRSESSSRAYSNKRYDGGTSSHGGRSNPFNNIAPLTTAGISSQTPRTGASSAFGLGSGAFGFGSANNRTTPKTPGTAFDFNTSGSAPLSAPPIEKKESKPKTPGASSKGPSTSSSTEEQTAVPSQDLDTTWPLQYGWVIWYRPPTSKNSDYEKSIRPMCRILTAQEFWKVFVHLKRPSMLPVVSDYHLFKEGIRPVWEDEANKRGGKWIIRLKKGVADRYWESLQMSMIGNQFAEAADEVCGAVISMRSGEDVISIWTKNDGGRNIKIRETVKRVLDLPADTIIVWKSHDDSIAQRTALDHARQEKNTQHEKRRATISQDDAVGSNKEKPAAGSASNGNSN